MSPKSKNQLPATTSSKSSSAPNKPDFELLAELQALGYKKIVGLDEVGRGAIAGPIVVAAVELSVEIDGVTDSKKIARPKREDLAKQIMSASNQLAYGQASPQEIDSLGIVAAQHLAYDRALAQIDGDIFLTDFYDLPGKNVIKAIKGDCIFYSVAAASIVAKVYRDSYMAHLAVDFPDYFWEKNVGYGTPAHNQAVLKRGTTIHHRLTFL